MKVLAPVREGERFLLTVQAMDDIGQRSQTQLEVNISPGPNIKPPFFSKLVYRVQVNKD